MQIVVYKEETRQTKYKYTKATQKVKPQNPIKAEIKTCSVAIDKVRNTGLLAHCSRILHLTISWVEYFFAKKGS